MTSKQEILYKTPFDKVGEYFLTLIDEKNKSREKELCENDWYMPINIDDRIENSNYFYMPNEKKGILGNCFEMNAHFYFALRHLYPESNPTLINLILDENGNSHSSVLFTHNDEEHFADPIEKVLGPVEIEPDKIKVKKNLISSAGEKREREFKHISQFSNQKLEEVIEHLKTDEGIVSFFYGSGQRASFLPEWPYYKELFIHIDEDFMVHGQIRTEDACPSDGNSMISIIYNPFSKEYTFETFTHISSSWQTAKEKKLLTSEHESHIDHFDATINVAKYLEKTHMSFSSKTNYTKRLADIKELPKDFEYAKKLETEVMNYYLDYVLEEDGDEFGVKISVSDLFSQLTASLTDRTIKPDMSKMGKSITDRNRFQLFQLANDFKRYAEVIAKNI